VLHRLQIDPSSSRSIVSIPRVADGGVGICYDRRVTMVIRKLARTRPVDRVRRRSLSIAMMRKESSSWLHPAPLHIIHKRNTAVLLITLFVCNNCLHLLRLADFIIFHSEAYNMASGYIRRGYTTTKRRLAVIFNNTS